MTTIIHYSKEELYDIRKNIKEKISSNTLDIIKSISNKSKIFYKKNNYKKNTNTWRGVYNKDIPVIGKPVKTDADKINREINGFLNKISNDNFSKILNEILNIISKNNKTHIIEETLTSIFEKALMQTIYCPLYVKICKSLIEKNKYTYDLINKKCNNYYNIIKKIDVETTTKKTDSYDKFCENIKNKKKIKGFTQFMGELYLNEIVDINIIKNINSLFIDNINTLSINKKSKSLEKNVECLCTMLDTIINNMNEFPCYEDIIKGLSKNKKLLPRHRFLFMDILDKLVK